MFPISVISHQTVIPPNSPDYVEHFDKIELPNREEYDLRITTVNVSVDTTGLYNITSQNTMIASIGTTSHMEFIVEAGYYTMSSLENIISLINVDEDNYCVFNCQVDFSNANDLRIILGYDNIICSGKSNRPIDISRGRNVLRVYSSLIKQLLNNESSTLVDSFIYTTIGLYNTTTFDNLSIPIDDFSTIDRIHWIIKDRNNELLNIDVPIYISFIISVI